MKNRFFTLTFVSLTAALLLSGCATQEKEYTVAELILENRMEEAKSYFQTKSDVNEIYEDGNTALHLAAMKNEDELASFLIFKGADMEIKNYAGETPLHSAIYNTSYETARVLCEAGADIFALNGEGTSALEQALSEDDVYYDIMINTKSAEKRDGNGDSIVHYFVRSESQNAIDYCIKRNINIDVKNNKGITPLALALSRTESAVSAKIAADLLLNGAEEVKCQASYFEDAVLSRNLNLRMNDGQTPLHLAAIYNHSGIASYLLMEEASTKVQDISGATPLHEAVRYGNVEIAKMLIDQGADVNARDSLGKTPLLLIIPQDKQEAMYSLLISSGANVNHKDMYGDTILHIASMTDMSPSVLMIFTSNGADVNIRNKQGLTPLATAIEHSYSDLIAFYVRCNADIHAEDSKGMTPLIRVLNRSDELYKSVVIQQNVNSIDSEGNTPLLIALKKNADYSKIEYIANLGCNINTRNREGNSALSLAVTQNNREAGELLLKKGADIFSANKNNISPLRLALTENNGSEQWLINSSTITARDGSGNTVLHYAAEWQLPQAVSYLIQKGADINATNANGETPLFHAAKSDNTETIDILLAGKASINARDQLGSTPLHAAVRWNALTSADKLISKGIDVNCQNIAGKTPLEEASVEGNYQMARLLLSRGADPNIYDANGRTSLSDVVRSNQKEMVQLLLENGANPSIQDLKGRTPYHESAVIGDTELIKLLNAAGANPLTRDKEGNTPFSLTLDKPLAVTFAVLGKQKSIVDSDGNTAVHIAVQKNATPSQIKSLIARKYPFDTRNAEGYTPLALSVSSKQKDIANLLLENGANPFCDINTKGDNVVSIAFSENDVETIANVAKYSANATDIRNNTLLHYAARLADQETVERLLALGISKDARNISGETPYDIAVSWKRPEIAELLK